VDAAEIVPWIGIVGKPSTFPPDAHAPSHQNGGGDEISVAGLSGLLADPQTPTAHAASHASGGGDPVKLDDLAVPDDNTDLNASMATHGLMQKYPGGTTSFLRADGTFAAPVASAGNLVPNVTVTTQDETIAADKSVVVGDSLEIGNTFFLEIGSASVLVIV
jgi:hypothetical protein